MQAPCNHPFTVLVPLGRAHGEGVARGADVVPKHSLYKGVLDRQPIVVARRVREHASEGLTRGAEGVKHFNNSGVAMGGLPCTCARRRSVLPLRSLARRASMPISATDFDDASPFARLRG